MPSEMDIVQFCPSPPEKFKDLHENADPFFVGKI
jgi:hypothetical protein